MAQENRKMAAQPFPRFAVIAELVLDPAKAPVVIRSENVVQVLVVDDRLHEKLRNIRGIEAGMDSNHRGRPVVRLQPDAVALLAPDAFSPLNAGTGVTAVRKVFALDLGRDEVQVMVGPRLNGAD